MLTGSNGILNQAIKAKENSRGAAVKEILELELANNNLIKQSGSGLLTTKEQLLDRLEKEGKLKEAEVTKLETTDVITIGQITIDFSAFFKKINLKSLGNLTYLDGYYCSNGSESLTIANNSNYNSLYFYADKNYDIYMDSEDLNECGYISICTIKNPSDINISGNNYVVNGKNPKRYRKSDNNMPSPENFLHIEKGDFVVFSKGSSTGEYNFYMIFDKTENNSNQCKVVYEVLSKVDANEKLKIFLPTKNGYIQYDFMHNVNSSINADNWRIDNAYHCDDNLNQLLRLTDAGEWECSVKLKGRNDFSGGIAHGDEVTNSITFIIDGQTIPANDITEMKDFNELVINEISKLYDPNDNTTEIANHVREYTINANGITINQSIEWLVNDTLELSYMAMFPIYKSVTNRIYTDLSPEVFEIINGKRMDFDGATKAVIYSDNEECYAKFEIIENPRNYIFMNDNGGALYNKLYSPACRSGDKCSINEVWRNTTKYKIDMGK